MYGNGKFQNVNYVAYLQSLFALKGAIIPVPPSTHANSSDWRWSLLPQDLESCLACGCWASSEYILQESQKLLLYTFRNPTQIGNRPQKWCGTGFAKKEVSLESYVLATFLSSLKQNN